MKTMLFVILFSAIGDHVVSSPASSILEGPDSAHECEVAKALLHQQLSTMPIYAFFIGCAKIDVKSIPVPKQKEEPKKQPAPAILTVRPKVNT